MAVYTELSDDEIAAFVADYELGAVVACKGIAEGIENSNFLLVAERGPHILTIYEKRVNESDLPFFLALLEHLAARGVPCPTPVRTRKGESLRQIRGKPAAIVTFLPGLWPRRPSPDQCEALGRAMAEFHIAGRDFPMTRGNDLSLTGWQKLLSQCLSQGGAVSRDLGDELQIELEALSRLWPASLPRGVIHADLFPDNVFFDGDRVSGIIDFYFACTDMLAYDLAIVLNAWCFESDGAFDARKARRLLRGYQSRRALCDLEVAALPVLARGAAVRFLLTRLYDWLNTPKDALVTPKNPAEYLHKLRFHRAVGGPEGYGFG